MRTEYSTKQTLFISEYKMEHVPMVFVFLVYPMQIAQKARPHTFDTKKYNNINNDFLFLEC